MIDKLQVDKQATVPKYIEQAKSEYGWEVSDPSYSSLPSIDEDISNILRHDKEFLARTWSFLCEARIVKDHFSAVAKDGHVDRRAFKDDPKNKKVTAWMEAYSKLRGNNIYVCLGSMNELVSKLERKKVVNIDSDLRKRLTALMSQFSGYNDLSFEEAVAYVESIDAVGYRLFEILSLSTIDE